jgi:hypothetical protein
LREISFEDKSPVAKLPDLAQRRSIAGYFIGFLLALVVEFFAAIPFLANIGQRHSSIAPETSFERISGYLAFISHLPTILPVYLFHKLFSPDWIGIFYLFVTPITQIIFWTWFLAYIFRKFRF